MWCGWHNKVRLSVIHLFQKYRNRWVAACVHPFILSGWRPSLMGVPLLHGGLWGSCVNPAQQYQHIWRSQNPENGNIFTLFRKCLSQKAKNTLKISVISLMWNRAVRAARHQRHSTKLLGERRSGRNTWIIYVYCLLSGQFSTCFSSNIIILKMPVFYYGSITKKEQLLLEYYYITLVLLCYYILL